MYAMLLTTLLTQAAPQDDRDNKFAKDATCEGKWTVLCYEKNGMPMEGAMNATVTIKDNVATFTPATGNKAEMKAMRFTFGGKGTIQVAEANADGKFDAAAPRPAGTGAAPAAAGMKSGVYVLTQSHLAVCIHDDAPRGGGDVQPAGGAAAADKPNGKSHCTVVLKRESRP